MTEDEIELILLRKYTNQHKDAELHSSGSKCARELDMRKVLADITGPSDNELVYTATLWLERLAQKASDSKGPLRRCSDTRRNEGDHRWHARAYRDSGSGSAPAWDRVRQLEASLSPPAENKPSLIKRIGHWLLSTTGKIVIGVLIIVLGAWAVFVCGPQGMRYYGKAKHPALDLESARIEVYQDDRTGRAWRVCHFRIQVHNPTATTMSIPNWKLTHLRRLENGIFSPWGEVDALYLEWPARLPKTIPPGDTVVVPFARLFPADLQRALGEDRLYSGDPDKPQLRFMAVPGGWSRRMSSHLPPGTYRFKLAVFFADQPPAETEFELGWVGEQRENVELMAKEIKLKKVTD